MLRRITLPWVWLKDRHRTRQLKRCLIDEASWARCLAQFTFLPPHPRLRELASLLLLRKEFSAVEPLALSDEQAIAVVAQAAVVILGISLRDEADLPSSRYEAIEWFDSFVGIVLHPSEMLARRTHIDEAGVSHFWREALSGEAVDGGPLTMSWQDVADADASSADGYNVVIHEFAHVLDTHSGHATGVPPLPSGFKPRGQFAMSSQTAHHHWQAVFTGSFERLQDQLNMSQRFGGQEPWLDPYAATDPAEFFAVATEAYFVNPHRFKAEWPELMDLFDAYFQAWRWR